MDSGFVKLYRGLMDSKVFANETALKVWVWCLLKASYKDRTISLKVGRGSVIVDLKAGQFIFGRHRAEEETGIFGLTVYRWLQRFETEEFDCMISLDVNSQYTIITINNWDSYQSEVNSGEQPMNNQRTTNEQPMNTYKKDKKDNIDTNVSIKSNNEVVSTNIDYDKLIDFFNEETKGVFGTIRKPISDKRKKMVRARISEYSKAEFVEVIKKANQSNFLKGDSGKFVMTFDWMIRPTNFEKILSDNYKNRDEKNWKSDTDRERKEGLAREFAEVFSE